MIKEVYIEIMKNLKEKYLSQIMRQYHLKMTEIIFFSAIVLSIILLWKLLHFQALIPTNLYQMKIYLTFLITGMFYFNVQNYIIAVYWLIPEICIVLYFFARY